MHRLRAVGVVLVLVLLATACGGDDGDAGGTTTTAGDAPAGTLTVYSGRSEELVGPVIEHFQAETGITVEVRYGDTAEMAATILEEGGNSPADVFFGQDAGALGALSSEGRFQELPSDLLEQVDGQYRSTNDDWVGVSGRARVVVYNTDDLAEDDLPDSILGFADGGWEGRLGWAPTNGSFQSFVTALRVLEGDDGAEEWLAGVQASRPEVYEKNSAIVEAVAAGEIDAGFVNHYYLYKLQSEGAVGDNVANRFYTDGDPGALVNVAGAGILDTADDVDAASLFIEYLLSDEGQRYFADETFELPLVTGVEPDAELPDLDALRQPDLDLNDLDDLAGTLELLERVGIL